MSPLAQRTCRPLPAGTPPLTPAELAGHLRELQGWAEAGRMLSKSWSFDNFHQTMAFVNAVAWIAHREDHHPDMTVGYNRCRVDFSTHSIGGISENDVICAAQIEAFCAAR